MDIDVVPIFLLHEQESIHTLRGHRPALDYLLKQRPRIVKAVGISTHYVGAVWAAAEMPEIDVISPLHQSHRHRHQNRDMEMLAAISHAAGTVKASTRVKPLGGGHLLSSWAALDFCLQQDDLAAVAVGMKSVEEVDHNVRYFNGERSLPQPDNNHRKLHVEEWCIGCGSCVAACPNSALGIVGGRAEVVEPSSCVFCGYCGASCPEFAIKVI